MGQEVQPWDNVEMGRGQRSREAAQSLASYGSAMRLCAGYYDRLKWD